MPRKEINYSNTVIYKIVCNDLAVTDVYVGSTTQFTKRKNQHKSNCNKETSKKYNIYVYTVIRANGGFSNWSMIEIEKYPCADANRAHARERYYIEQLQAKLNKTIPTRTDKEYKKENSKIIKEKNKIYTENNKDKIKLYREHNKDKIKQIQKDYWNDNKQVLKEKHQEYILKNKDTIKNKQKQFREENKLKIQAHDRQFYANNKEKKKLYQQQKYNCPCGSIVCQGDKGKHFKAKKHIQYLENLPVQE